MNFSKSKYTQGIQCPKMLWMKKNMPDQFDESVMNDAVLEAGNMVGDLAMGYYGPFVEVAFDPSDPERFTKAAAETKKLLEAGEKIICEATFSIPGHYCMVDILLVRDDGSFDMVEVKSSTKTKDVYFHDMAYQCWLIHQCGYRVNSVSLMHINNGYVREGNLDLQKLFTVEDHTQEVFKMAKRVGDHVADISSIADAPDEPLTPIGLQCFSPYECGFRKHCFRNLPENNVFDLSAIGKKKAFALLERGCASFEDLASDTETFSKLSGKQQMQVLMELDQSAPHIDKSKVGKFLDSLSFPLYFLDFETFQEAVPSFNGEHPFEQVTSQYSLHWKDSLEGELHHAEFLADANGDPRRAVAENLCRDIPEDVCVLAWNMSFEKGRIKEMAALYPDLSDHLLSIRDNIKDLMAPFKQMAFYSKEMRGSSSIKAVLPALFPNDQELDYHALDGVHNGGEAANAFLGLSKLPFEEQNEVREQLLRYCELDTLAMVRIWERMVEECCPK